MAELLTPDICVIGGGAGGLAVAIEARSHGASVVLVERGRLGGEALNSASLPSKALVAAARRAHEMRTASAFGLANDQPRINARGVFDHVHEVIDGIAPTVSADHLAALGIELVAAEGKFVDPRMVEAGGKFIRARRFVIATGSRPLVPEIAGLGEVPYFTSASIFDNPRKLSHLVIIGGGPVGIELAQAFRRLGSDVTVVERATPLGRSDPELSDIALRRAREEGVNIRSGAAVTAVQLRSLGIGVTVSTDGVEEVLDASHILVAIGRVPALEGLDLDKADVRRKGPAELQLKPNFLTTNRRVYAIGDAAGGPQQTHAATHHAGLVVRHILYGLPVRNDPTLVPTVVYTDPEIAEVGLTEPEAKRLRGTDYRVYRLPFAENHRARAERQGYGLAKLITDRAGRLLGAGIVGEGAGEMVSLFAFAIANGLGATHFRKLVAPYPTLAEIARTFGEEAGRSLPESPWLKRLMAINRRLP